MTSTGLRADDVVAAVRRHFGAERDGIGPEWAALGEFSLFPGAGGQRADVFLIRAWSGRPKGHERIAVEVKVSRSDLLSELRKPEKAQAFMAVSHRFYLAAPAGVIRADDPIPDDWGILVANRNGCRKVREAQRRDHPDPMPEQALVEAFRRASRAEARIRGADENDPAALVPDLARRLAAAEAAEHRARRAADRDRRRLSGFLAAVAEAGGWLCLCGQPMKKPLDDLYARTHADGSQCGQGRYGWAGYDLGSLAARLGLDPEDREDAAFLGGYVARPTPAEVLEYVRDLIEEAVTPGADAATLLDALTTMREQIDTALPERPRKAS